jgi:single-strand DNA-binding protein
MFSLNRAMVIGNATRDAELRTTPNGKSVASFSVATNRRWTDNGETRDEVEYHEITCWGKLAEIADQIVKKGTKLYVEGRLQTRSWEGKDGNKREKTEIVAENLIALSPKGDSYKSDYTPSTSTQETPKETAKPKETKKESSVEDDINLDDIPF